jgi:hypothetical protein
VFHVIVADITFTASKRHSAMTWKEVRVKG